MKVIKAYRQLGQIQEGSTIGTSRYDDLGWLVGRYEYMPFGQWKVVGCGYVLT